jgi:hypothetical protein
VWWQQYCCVVTAVLLCGDSSTAVWWQQYCCVVTAVLLCGDNSTVLFLCRWMSVVTGLVSLPFHKFGHSPCFYSTYCTKLSFLGGREWHSVHALYRNPLADLKAAMEDTQTHTAWRSQKIRLFLMKVYKQISLNTETDLHRLWRKYRRCESPRQMSAFCHTSILSLKYILHTVMQHQGKSLTHRTRMSDD